MWDEARTIEIRGRFGIQFVFVADSDIIPDAVAAISDLLRGILGFKTLHDTRKFAEGSFAKVWRCGEIVGRFVPESAGDKFLAKMLKAARTCVDLKLLELYCFGKVYRESDKHVLGVVQFMPFLQRLSDSFDDEESVLSRISQISQYGFHNDFKLDNLMMTSTGELRVLDFDFFDEDHIVISVTSFQNIAVDLVRVLSEIPQDLTRKFRSFYDYTYLSASLDGSHPLYRKVLNRLEVFFVELLEAGIFDKIRTAVGQSVVTDIPFEVLVRCPNVDAVSIHLFDLRGNAYAHRLPEWERFPSIIKSSGVYWPDR